MDNIGKYNKTAIPDSRLLTIDTTAIGLRKRYVKALVELDVTDAREIIKNAGRDAGRPLSFTAWLMKCIGAAAAEYPEVHALRKGRKLYTFEDVDISTLVETELKGKLVPLPVVIRKTNEKSVEEISNEIKSYKAQGTPDGDLVLGDRKAAAVARLTPRLPSFVRRLGMKFYFGNPIRSKKSMGTVVVTSVGMFGITGGWAIPISIHPLSFAIGGIARKPAVYNDAVVPRDILNVTILFDHDVVDGAFAARFTSRLSKLIQSAHGLETV